jgi:hypothetical protein
MLLAEQRKTNCPIGIEETVHLHLDIYTQYCDTMLCYTSLYNKIATAPSKAAIPPWTPALVAPPVKGTTVELGAIVLAAPVAPAIPTLVPFTATRVGLPDTMAVEVAYS